jgi:hypothetical protein
MRRAILLHPVPVPVSVSVPERVGWPFQVNLMAILAKKPAPSGLGAGLI